MKKVLILTLLSFYSACLMAVPVADPREPPAIVEETTTAILDTLDSRREEFTRHPERLMEVVNRDMLPFIDTEYSARLILGRAGRDATPEQLGDFAQAMSDHLLSRYAEGLLRFESDNRLEVLPLKGKNTEKLTRVRTRFALENGNSVPIDFAFRKTELGWKAFDVTIEGISYVMTYRNQIAPRVVEEGIERVTEDIREGSISLQE